MKMKKKTAVTILVLLSAIAILITLYLMNQLKIYRANERLGSLPSELTISQSSAVISYTEESEAVSVGGILLKIGGNEDYYLISAGSDYILTVYGLPGSLTFGGRNTPMSLFQAAQAGGLSEVRALLKENGITVSRQIEISSQALESILSNFGRLEFHNPSPVGDAAHASTLYFAVGNQSLTGFQTAEFFKAADPAGRDAATRALIEKLVLASINETSFNKLLEMVNSNIMAADRLYSMDY